MTRVLLAEDTKIVMDGIKSILAKKPEKLKLVAEAADGQIAMELLKKKSIDVAILDIELPKVTGLQLTEHIKEHYPETKVLIISMYKKLQYIKAAIGKGAKGYILKDNSDEDELFSAIEKVMAGGVYFDDEVMKIYFDNEQGPSNPERAKLTRREKEILQLTYEGLSGPEMAEKLHIALSTIETHRRHLMEKMDVKNVVGLVKKAIEEGYLEK